MRRPIAIGLVLLLLLLTGCGVRSQSQPPEQPEPSNPPAKAEPPSVEAPDLWQVPGPRQLTLAELEAGLERTLNAGRGSAAEQLAALYAHWGLPWLEGKPRLIEADLTGEGEPEVVTALNAGQESLAGTGTLFVIYGEPGEYRVDRLAGEYPGVALHAVHKLAGDNRPEIVWTETQVGAHTAHSKVHVTQWQPGSFTTLPGDMEMSNMQLSIDGRELVLRGGLIGSVGAGGTQRERTERYRFSDGAFRLIDLRFAPSEWGYHRLIDGIAAESVGRTEDATADFRAAMELPAASRGMVDPGEAEAPEKVEALTQAVQAFARFRLGALLLEQGEFEQARALLQAASGPFAGLSQATAGAQSRVAGCEAAARWARENPAFLDALNSPWGYATPLWQPELLCGGLPQGR